MIAYRVSSYDTPCPPSPSRRDSRWGHEGGPVVNYWSLHPHGCWAEVYRAEGLLQFEDVYGKVAQRLWVADLSHLEVVDIHDLLDDLGMADDDLVSDWAPCQRAALQLVADGHLNVRVPSAALPGTDNLVLFEQRFAVPFSELSDGEWDVPCAVAADRSHGALDVVAATRHYGSTVLSGSYEQMLPTPLPAELLSPQEL